MVGIIKFFGWLSIIAAIVLFALSFTSVYVMTAFVPAGAGALLGGAMLIVFGRIVELLEELNNKMSPVTAIATSLASKYGLEGDINAKESREKDPFDDLPSGAQIKAFKGRRVAFLPDGSVFAETMTGPMQFRSFEEYRDYIGQ